MFLPMNSTLHTIRCQFNQAMVTQFGEHLAGTDPLLVPASHPKFGDYQSNIALSLAKQLGHPPEPSPNNWCINLRWMGNW
jgi:arginyl-tRNA synthetase